MDYKLLTPGPITTSRSVKQEMLFDYSTWDDDYKAITQTIRQDLLRLAAVDADSYSSVLMQGSGTFGVESVLSSLITDQDKLLICTNGAYGERIIEISRIHKLNYSILREQDSRPIDPHLVEAALEADDAITHVIVVHSETTTGLLNDIEALGHLTNKHGKVFIVDAMSSFAGYHIPVADWHIDMIISSANKCIQGVPGFAFVIGRQDLIKASKGNSRSLSLGLYEQWEVMDLDGKWRFTSPTHTVLAFRKALDELEQEGGISARQQRYQDNNKFLNEEMTKLGFDNYLQEADQGPIISTFLIPDNLDFNFDDLYAYTKANGYVIYPGKLTNQDSFRIGNIGEIYRQDIINVTQIIKQFMKTIRKRKIELLIFDWAGTTVDFGCMAPLAAFRQAFADRGIEVEDAEIRQPMGMSKKDHVRSMLEMKRIRQAWFDKYQRDWTEADVQDVYQLSEEALMKTVGDYSEPKPYVVEVLKQLRSQGYKIGSSTGYNKAMMAIVMPKAKDYGYYSDYMTTSEDCHGMGRPYPYMIFKNMAHFAIEDLRSVVKIGDTVADIKEGKNAKVTTIAVIDGSSEMGLSLEEFQALSPEEKNRLRQELALTFRKAGADYTIDDMTHLPGLLEEIQSGKLL